MYKEKRIPFFVRLSETVVRQFREYVSLKYSTDRYGWQSYEVELALKTYLGAKNSLQQITQTRDLNENRILKTRKAMDEIKSYFIKTELYIDPPKVIAEKHLDEAITNLHGLDPRTVKKWKEILQRYGHIKRIDQFRFEILR